MWRISDMWRILNFLLYHNKKFQKYPFITFGVILTQTNRQTDPKTQPSGGGNWGAWVTSVHWYITIETTSPKYYNVTLQLLIISIVGTYNCEQTLEINFKSEEINVNFYHKFLQILRLL